MNCYNLLILFIFIWFYSFLDTYEVVAYWLYLLAQMLIVFYLINNTFELLMLLKGLNSFITKVSN